VFYQFFLKFFSNTYGKPVRKGENWSKLTIIIPTYNEENVIERKINNTLELEYAGNIEIIIVDSNSSDNTVQIAQKFKTVKIIEEETRLGKTHALNRALKESTGEIVVMTDANGYSTSKNLLIEIAQNFFDPSVGAVAVPMQHNSSNWKTESVFWKRERNLWSYESTLDSIPSASGKCLAFKRSLVEELNPKCLADDMDIILQVRKKGFRVVSESTVSVLELVPSQLSGVVFQKVRRMVNVMSTMFNYKSLMFNPRYGWYGSMILPTRKLFPLLMPFIGFVSLLSLFLLNFYLGAILVLILIVLFFISSTVRSFLTNQLLIVVAWYRYVFKRYDIAWEKATR
jgi:cellulose synthase/poly-beta-1,6-N-acetylglucosamine synthase-like glycosyltransferase